MASKGGASARVVEWAQNPVAHILLAKKHTIAVLLYLYQNGSGSTSDVIRGVGGHPASIIETLRTLEEIGTLVRPPFGRGHRIREARLTVKGMQLVETPVYRWGRLLRDWHRIQAEGTVSLSERNR